MSLPRSALAVGTGLAGAGTPVEALRSFGYEDRITLVGDERDRPYVRPPLSKEYLKGVSGREALYVHEDDWYRDSDVDLARRTPGRE